MSLGWIGVGYTAVGIALAIVLGIARRSSTIGDRLLVVLLWPVGAPLLWVAHAAAPSTTLLAALSRARSSPLASVLPDAETANVLQARLAEATSRLAELDDVLSRSDFDVTAAERRADELRLRGATTAAATAQLRVRTLGQLHELRVRYRCELDDVRELIAQLVTQAELVRLQPAVAHASGELVRELVARVEGLGDLFAYQSVLEYPVEPGRLT
ncbi:MAG: hypothetical protein AB7P03_13065 [Kofleriaceae bacterium]